MKSSKSIWILITILLSIVVIVVGYPAFQERIGGFNAVFWTLACVAGVWLTYFIRAKFWN